MLLFDENVKNFVKRSLRYFKSHFSSNLAPKLFTRYFLQTLILRKDINLLSWHRFSFLYFFWNQDLKCYCRHISSLIIYRQKCPILQYCFCCCCLSDPAANYIYLKFRFSIFDNVLIYMLVFLSSFASLMIIQ